jgi:hypothetical protein
MIHSYITEEYAAKEDVSIDCVDKGSSIEITWDDNKIEVTPLILLSWMFIKVK